MHNLLITGMIFATYLASTESLNCFRCTTYDPQSLNSAVWRWLLEWLNGIYEHEFLESPICPNFTLGHLADEFQHGKYIVDCPSGSCVRTFSKWDPEGETTYQCTKKPCISKNNTDHHGKWESEDYCCTTPLCNEMTKVIDPGSSISTETTTVRADPLVCYRCTTFDPLILKAPQMRWIIGLLDSWYEHDFMTTPICPANFTQGVVPSGFKKEDFIVDCPRGSCVRNFNIWEHTTYQCTQSPCVSRNRSYSGEWHSEDNCCESSLCNQEFPLNIISEASSVYGTQILCAYVILLCCGLMAYL